MAFVQFHKIEGEIRLPVGEKPSFLEIHLEDDREIVSIDWRTPTFLGSDNRKTADWRYTVWAAWRAR
jgi:hypothetical protein